MGSAYLSALQVTVCAQKFDTYLKGKISRPGDWLDVMEKGIIRYFLEIYLNDAWWY